MNIKIISYSFTGNNEALSNSIASKLSAQHIRITEPSKRTIPKIFFDIVLGRTPKINPMIEKIENDDFVIFMGPVWMRNVATPLRPIFKQFKDSINKYAFVTISGGAIGPNIKAITNELKKRIGKDPSVVIERYLTDFMPVDFKPSVKNSMDYSITDQDVEKMSSDIVGELQNVIKE